MEVSGAGHENVPESKPLTASWFSIDHRNHYVLWALVIKPYIYIYIYIYTNIYTYIYACLSLYIYIYQEAYSNVVLAVEGNGA